MAKLLYDLFPVALFYITYKRSDIYIASGVIIVASILQVLYSYFKNKKIENMHLISLVIVIVMGSATIILRNELFIKWKITAVNLLFGFAFLGSHFIGEKVIIARMLDGKFELPEKVLVRLNIGWTLFFFFLSGLNTYIIYNYSTDVWMNFKVYGVIGISLIFVLIQAIYMAAYTKNLKQET